MIDKAENTVGLGSRRAYGPRRAIVRSNWRKAFDALGVSVIEEYSEWKPEGAPTDLFSAMHKGHTQIYGGSAMKDKIAYAFGAEFVEVRINRWTHEIRVPRLVGGLCCQVIS